MPSFRCYVSPNERSPLPNLAFRAASANQGFERHIVSRVRS